MIDQDTLQIVLEILDTKKKATWQDLRGAFYEHVPMLEIVDHVIYGIEKQLIKTDISGSFATFSLTQKGYEQCQDFYL